MVPGPTSMTATVRQAYADDVGSPDVELDEFASDYFDLEESLKRLLSFDGSIAIGSGEGMACLWGALKSVLRPGDVVVSGANGIYGQVRCELVSGACLHVDSHTRRDLRTWRKGLAPLS
ncbi:hypothetical protein DYB35_008106 [Aphanomyces astaci]|uniref:Aminotransferase class V domain-containing protein n=1 Tax=Aphanomyces astaci TaxID=112090 RepID=A0A3R6WXY5_APHAT|nr:hypothetical protein DYB35_008106 [Aphanomyces astaci]